MKTAESEQAEDARPRTFLIGPDTRVTLSFFILLIGAIAGGAWKLSAITAKIDSMSQVLATAATDGSDLKRRVYDHERQDSERWTQMQSQIDVIKQSGSPKLQDYEKRLTELEIRFSIHERMAVPGGPIK